MDFIGPLTIKYKHPMTMKDIAMEMQILTMIDVCTNWPELARLSNLTAKNAAIIFDKQWLSRYLRPLKVGHDNGTEFTRSKIQ